MASLFDRIEPETRAYLKKVFLTLFYGLGWMFANVIAGLVYQQAYISGKLSVGNIVYYACSVTLLALFIWWLFKTWNTRRN